MAAANGERVGITTTLPIEVLFAAGLRPVDLNNLFIARGDAGAAVAAAETEGFPRNVCAWIKGLYTTVIEGGFERVVVVTGGDCSNALALGELWAAAGVEVVPFSFPPRPDREALAAEVERLAARMGTTAAAAGEQYERLRPSRELLRELDEVAAAGEGVSGREHFDWLLRACDFGGDVARFEDELRAFLAGRRRRRRPDNVVRLGLAGVPPINDGLWEYLEELGAAVVYFELPRQFALLGGGADLADAYGRYTYPYGVAPRLADLARAVADRRLAGVIHYVQSFCYRGIQDILIRRRLAVPVLTLEGERPGPLSAQQKLRLETFVELLRGEGARPEGS